MKLLIDSQVVIWGWTNDPRLSLPTRSMITDPNNDVYSSVATVWELELKRAKGKLTLPGPVISGLRQLSAPAIAIDAEDTEAAASLPRHHDDPFDRMLIAQALRRGLTIVTSDAELAKYGVPVLPP